MKRPAPKLTKLPPLVGLSGKIGSGKTYLANYLRDQYGYDICSFASALKRDIIDLGFPEQDVLVTKPPTIRQLLQAYGAARRAQYPGYWIKRLFDQDLAWLTVIDDVRYPNEVEAIHAHGGIVIRVQNLDRPHTGEHESETALDDHPTVFDAVIFAGQGELNKLVSMLETALDLCGAKEQ